MTAGCGVSLVSNQDDVNKTGFKFVYFPPDYNAGWFFVNGYRTIEQRSMLSDDYVKLTFVATEANMMMFKNGELLATTEAVEASQVALTFGGLYMEGYEPQKYQIRNIKVYQKAVMPSGFDPSLAEMYTVSGEGYSIQRAVITDTSLPRILVIGDSISMGYRGYITEYYAGRAYVDYWIGGAWVNGPTSVLGDDSEVKRAWEGALSEGPYDVITWNPMGLHMWGPDHQAVRTPEDQYPQMIKELVEHHLSVQPTKTTLFWVSTTPRTSYNETDQSLNGIDEASNHYIELFNGISSDVMVANGVPQIDLYGLCLQNLDKARSDGVHWNPDMYKIMADYIISQIDPYVPTVH